MHIAALVILQKYALVYTYTFFSNRIIQKIYWKILSSMILLCANIERFDET
jgi:hypothetical protein